MLVCVFSTFVAALQRSQAVLRSDSQTLGPWFLEVARQALQNLHITLNDKISNSRKFFRTSRFIQLFKKSFRFNSERLTTNRKYQIFENPINLFSNKIKNELKISILEEIFSLPLRAYPKIFFFVQNAQIWIKTIIPFNRESV